MAYGQLPVTSNALAVDARSLNSLKLQAGKSTPDAIKETAKQFESLFMRELLKSMREATMKSGMTDNPGSDLGTDLLDQQFAVQMSGQAGGLSDLIAQQLSRQMGGATLDPSALVSGAAAAPDQRPQPGHVSRGLCGQCQRRAHSHHPDTKQLCPATRRGSLPRGTNQRPAVWLHAGASRVTKPAGAGTKSNTPMARRRSTCLASRPQAAGTARWPKSRPPSTSTASPKKRWPSSAPMTPTRTRSRTTPA